MAVKEFPEGRSYRVYSSPPRLVEGAVSIPRLLVRATAFVLAFFALLVAAVLLITISPTLSRSVTAFFIPSQSAAVPWNGTDPVNMIVAGLDLRPGPGQVPHTDTIMVMSVNPHTDSVHMFSIPRDLWVSIPGYGYDRVNDAYWDGGTKLLMKTAEGITNLPIRYYAIVKFNGFQKVIDSLGGVTIDVKHAINDPKYPAPVGSGFAPLHIKAGVQHMNGTLALEYVRERHDDPLGDLGRNQRQQQLLVAMKKQALNPATIFKLPALLDALGQSVDTNFPYTDLTYLARLVMTGHVQRTALTYSNNTVSNYVTPAQADVLLGNWQRIHWLAHLAFGNPALGATPIEVLNGSGLPGEAASLAQWLRACGFVVSRVGDASSQNYQHTELIRNTGQSSSDFVARMASDLLQASVSKQTVPGATGPLVVIIGRDWNSPVQN